MCAVPHFNGRIPTFVVALALIALEPLTTEAAWKITRFEVFAGAPYVRADGVVEYIGFDWAEAEDLIPSVADLIDNDLVDAKEFIGAFDKAEVERALNEAAEWYSKEGFPEPILEPEVQTDNGPAYRVYVCTEAYGVALWASEWWQQAKSLVSEPELYVPNWSSCGASYGSDTSDWAAYSGPCAVSKGSRPVLYINADGPAFKDGKLTAEGYQTMAHELFHAIQANTVMDKSPEPCNRGLWIGEGQADAVTIDLLDEIWSTVPQPDTDAWVTKSWGKRMYNDQLTVDTQGYATSSFWRFLGDLNGGYDFLITGEDGTRGVFDFEIEEAGNWKSEVSWLDKGLHANFNLHLNALLGLFINDYAMRIPLTSNATGSVEEDWPFWVEGALGKCQEITLSDRRTSQIFHLDLPPLAGQCAWLTVNVPQATAQVSLQAESGEPSVFRDVWVGLAEGAAIVVNASVAGTSPTDPGKSIGLWSYYTIRTGFPTLLTFTNAADKPDESRRHEVDFKISLPSSTSSLRSPAPAGPGKAASPAARPSYKKHTYTLKKKTAAAKAMIAEQKRLDREMLSPHAPGSTMAKLRLDEPPCVDPFSYTPCGPYISINLALMPGTYGYIGHSAGVGGAGGQLFSSLMGEALSNAYDSGAGMTELAQKLESIDASGVSIVMPFVDYGFTGSISNARITTRIGGIEMESVGPMNMRGEAPLIGSVSVEEFTPFVIRGSFSAPLAYFDGAPSPDQLPVHRKGPTLTGTFNHVAPWLEDTRVTRIQLQSKAEIVEEVGSSLGLSPEEMRSLREQAPTPDGSGPAGSGISGSGDKITGGCDCNCANKGKVDELCEFYCEEEFAACP